MSVDNLPTELPREASLYFGDSLLPFLETIVKSDGRKPYPEQTDLPPEIHRAVITSHGQLTPKFLYVLDLRRAYESRLHQVLLLGSGFVSSPVVDYIMRDSSNRLTIGMRLFWWLK